MAVATQPRRLRLLLPGGSDGATVRVRPLRCGEVQIPPKALDCPTGAMAQLRGLGLTTPKSRWSWIPVPVFLVEHPTAGPLLIDTGFDASVQDTARTSLGRRQSWLLPARQAAGESAPEQLRALGIEPERIGTILMTHLHNDHASGAVQFPHATFVVDAAEWRAASTGGFADGYRQEHYDQPFDWRTVDFDGPDAVAYGGFARSLDLFGDGSVRLVSTPGHTRGHQSVLLALADRELLLTGDAAYTRRSIDEDLIPIFYADAEQYAHSLAAIRKHLRSSPATIVIAGHDAELWPQLDALYA